MWFDIEVLLVWDQISWYALICCFLYADCMVFVSYSKQSAISVDFVSFLLQKKGASAAQYIHYVIFCPSAVQRDNPQFISEIKGMIVFLTSWEHIFFDISCAETTYEPKCSLVHVNNTKKNNAGLFSYLLYHNRRWLKMP